MALSSFYIGMITYFATSEKKLTGKLLSVTGKILKLVFIPKLYTMPTSAKREMRLPGIVLSHFGVWGTMLSMEGMLPCRYIFFQAFLFQPDAKYECLQLYFPKAKVA